MDTKLNVSGNSGGPGRMQGGRRVRSGAHGTIASDRATTASCFVQFPVDVRESALSNKGEYDARRLRSQREVIRDVMLAAADCDTWLTLGELRALTRYGEASISAQLRHLRKTENRGYDVTKRHREGAAPAHPATDGRGDCVWEYRVTRLVDGGEIATLV